MSKDMLDRGDDNSGTLVKGGTQLDEPNSYSFYFLCQTLLLPTIVQDVKHRSNGFKSYVQNPLGTKKH